MPQVIKPDHPIIILIRGLPGSGKSYLAQRLVKRLGEAEVVSLDPDQTDYESAEYKKHVKSQIAEGVDNSLHAYRFLRARAYKGIEDDKIVIWNQPFTNQEIFQKMVGRFEEHAQEFNKKLSILVVEVKIDIETAKQRVDERKSAGGHGPSDNTFERFTKDNASFDSSSFNNIEVYGRADITKSVDQIIEALAQL